MWKLAQYTCVLALSAMAMRAQTVPVAQNVRTFGMAGLAEGQTARVNLLNPGASTGSTCTAVVTYLDGAGDVLKTATISAAPGKAAGYELDSDTELKLAINSQRQIRATVAQAAAFPPNAAAGALPVASCALIPTLEIYDSISQKSTIVLTRLTDISTPLAATSN